MPWEMTAVLSASVTESPEGWVEIGRESHPATRRQGVGVKEKKNHNRWEGIKLK